jgi:hypothetical protein
MDEEYVKILEGDMASVMNGTFECYECPSCNDDLIMLGHYYCPACGIKIHWIELGEE